MMLRTGWIVAKLCIGGIRGKWATKQKWYLLPPEAAVLAIITVGVGNSLSKRSLIWGEQCVRRRGWWWWWWWKWRCSLCIAEVLPGAVVCASSTHCSLLAPPPGGGGRRKKLTEVVVKSYRTYIRWMDPLWRHGDSKLLLCIYLWCAVQYVQCPLI